MKKKLATVLMGIMIFTLLAGCAGGNKATEKEVNTDGNAAEVKATEGAEKEVKAEEPTTLHLAIFNYANMDDMDAVLKKANEITLRELNIVLEIEVIPGSSWQQQMNMILSSGEELDIFPAFATPLATYVANGQVQALDELLAQYGADIPEAIGADYLDCGKVSGKLYGITTNRDLAAQNGFWMRKDLCDKYNIDVNSLKTLEDIEKALLTIHKGEPDLYPVVPQSNAVPVGISNWDDLSNGLGVLMDYGKELQVVNLYETEEYKNYTETMHRWYQEGLIMKDVLNNTETSESLVRSGKAVGAFAGMKPGFEEQVQRDTGYEVVRINLAEPLSLTGNAAGLTWCISSNSKNSEAAMKFLNFAYTSFELNNLLIYGIENVHYKYVDKDNNIIDYADGLDANTTPYSPSLGWAWFNQFKAAIWNGNSPDYWNELAEFNAKAIKSGAMGYTFDSSNVKAEITTCTNITDKYVRALQAGVVDPKEALPQMNEELKKAGLDKIIAEKQVQIDEWVKAKGNQ
ncbi:MAG TPA: ABC transporter substrate-binding protein [Clostridiales bacterium]|nr:ABC transporter substrate-binding protein [Clostridiales bacterium]